MARFRDNLKSIRETFGLSQAELGRQIGVGKSSISMYETGKREPDLNTIEAIADYFGIGLAMLMGDTDNSGLAQDEGELLAAYRALSDLGKRYIRQTMQLAIKSYGELRGEDHAPI